MTAADVLIDTLCAWGIDTAFGLPGDSIDPVMDALRRDGRIRFYLVRHEEAAALAASAYAKASGRMAACLGTAGPGSVHLLNGLLDARLDHVPVLALSGQVDRHVLGTGYFQEVDLPAILAHGAPYSQLCTEPETVGVLADTACRRAMARSEPAHLSIPFDVAAAHVSPDTRTAAPFFQAARVLPHQEDLDHAGEVIDRARRPVLFAGRGALQARGVLTALAEHLWAPVVHTLPAKGVIAEDHPLAMGGLGLLGAAPAHHAMEKADLLVMIGTNYPYLDFLPPKVTTIQIDRDSAALGQRHSVTVGLAGTARDTLEALMARTRKREEDAWVRELQHERDKWHAHRVSEGNRRDEPLHPQVIAQAVYEVFPPDTTVVVDVGNVLVWMAQCYRVRGGQFLTSAWLGTMGFGIPGAIGASIALGKKPVVSVCGDGGFDMQIADLVTAVRYHLPITFVVLRNDKLAMIKYEQEVSGYPEYEVDLVNPDFCQVAKAVGARGVSVRRFDEVRPALEEARDSGTVTVVDCAVRANELPLPPRLKVPQATHYALALFRETFE